MLEEKIEEMEESLPPPIRSRYQRVSQRHTRAVVPVIRGTCYGCFVSIPTSVASGAGRNAQIRHCDSCGRLLYMVG
jgi:predicted  nucleic acid-binding Zn-ribbon protein